VKKGLLILAAVIAFFGLLAYMTMGQRQYRVEVCMEFQGHQQCRTASGATKQGAQRTAAENACALISSGMTDTMDCQHRPPVKVEWK